MRMMLMRMMLIRVPLVMRMRFLFMELFLFMSRFLFKERFRFGTNTSRRFLCLLNRYMMLLDNYRERRRRIIPSTGMNADNRDSSGKQNTIENAKHRMLPT